MQYQDHGEVFGYSDSYVELLSDELDKVKAERDALLLYKNLADEYGLSIFEDMSKIVAERNAAVSAANEISMMMVHEAREWEKYVNTLKSALRDVKKNIETVFYGRWLDEQGPPIHKAITTINKVLGEGNDV